MAVDGVTVNEDNTEEDIDECIRRFDKVLSKCEKID